MFIAKTLNEMFPSEKIFQIYYYSYVSSAFHLSLEKKHIQRTCSVIYKIELHQSGLTSRFILGGYTFQNNMKKTQIWRSLALSSVI